MWQKATVQRGGRTRGLAVPSESRETREEGESQGDVGPLFLALKAMSPTSWTDSIRPVLIGSGNESLVVTRRSAQKKRSRMTSDDFCAEEDESCAEGLVM